MSGIRERGLDLAFALGVEDDRQSAALIRFQPTLFQAGAADREDLLTRSW
jgi:hypothetical protein